MKALLSRKKLRIAAFLLVCLLVVLTSQSNAQPLDITGNYTIDPDGGAFNPGINDNFLSFNEAVDTLVNRGVGGAVVIDVANGTYDEAFTITAIPGAGAVNTITFQSALEDSSAVYLNYSGFSESSQSIVTLNGASYITFKHLGFNMTQGSTYGKGLTIEGGSHHITFLSNFFTGIATAGSIYNDNRALILCWLTDDEYMEFRNNRFVAGENAIKMAGESTTVRASGWLIEDNVFIDQGDVSIYLQFMEAPVVKNNSITITATVRRGGLHLADVYNAFEVSGNAIRLDDIAYGIYMQNCYGSGGQEGMVFNNFVSSNINGGPNRGILINTSNNIKIYHNSVYFTDGWNSSSACLIQENTGTGLDIRNNSFANFVGGYAINISDDGSVSESDNNNYFSTGTFLGYWEGDKITLTDIAAASNDDASSISVNPRHNSLDDLHTTNYRLEGKGTTATMVTDLVTHDIDDFLRLSPPDIGADEFDGEGTPMSGEFYVGGTVMAPYFTTLTEAMDSLNEVGVDGPVIFNLRNASVFSEQISIQPISGASAVNTVTIRSDPANSGQASISFNSSADANYTVLLRRVNYLTLKNLIINAENATSSTAIRISGYSHHDSIVDCTIVSAGTTSTNNAAIWSDGHIHSDLYIGNNIINGGYYGISIQGLNHVLADLDNIEVRDNTIAGNYKAGVYLVRCAAPEVTGNSISDGTSTVDWWGINLYQCSNNYKILNNIIKYSKDDGGIQINECTSSFSFPALIANNYVEKTGDNADQATCIYTLNSIYVDVFHNTSRISGGNSNTISSAFNNDGGNNITVNNNNLVNFGNGYAMYNHSATAVDSSNYNNLFSGGTYLSHWGATDYSRLSDYQDDSGEDDMSQSVNPWFLSNDDHHINSSFLDGKGIYISAVDKDLDGQDRESPPDIGSDEFVVTIGPIPTGTYTIGGTSPDYITVTDAFTDLENRGISGPVRFSIRDGQYDEHLSLYQVPGASPRDTIVVESESGNADDVSIVYPTADPVWSVLGLVGVDYFTLQNVSLSATGGSVGRPLSISGVTDNLKILNNNLNIAHTSWVNLKIEKGAQDSILIMGNNLAGGYGGIGIDGTLATPATNLRIIDNYMTGASNKGIDLLNCIAPEVIANTILGPSQFSGIEAIELEGCSNRMVVTGNKINLANSGTGILLYNSDATSPPYNGIVSNNMITLRGSSSVNFGIELNGSDYIHILHNSIRSSNGRGILVRDGVSNIDIINNVTLTQGYAIQVNAWGLVNTCDYNSWYTTGTYVGLWAQTNETDLADLQARSGKDVHSISVNPLYYSSTDLHSSQVAFREAAFGLEDVPYDIDSVLRDPDFPDMGAMEFDCLEPDYNILFSTTCMGDSTTFVDSSTNIPKGSTYGWDFDGNFIAEKFTEGPFGTIKHLFPTAGVHTVNYIVEQISGCKKYTPLEVTVRTSPVLDITTTGAYCDTDDGTVSVEVANSTEPNTYSWSDGSTDSTRTGLALGDYTVAVTDPNGCTTDSTITIDEAIEVTVELITTSSCGKPDGSAEVSASGGIAPYSYVWDNGVESAINTELGAGFHYVNVIDSEGCFAQGSINMPNDGTGPQIDLEEILLNECFGERNGRIEIDISGGDAPYSIQWSNGETTDTISGLAAGIYNVVVKDAEGCIGVGSFNITAPERITVSPIVTNANCEGFDGKAVAAVSGGIKPYVYQWSTGGKFQIEEGLAAGVYSVNIIDGNGCEHVQPVIVNNVDGPVVVIVDVTGVGCTVTDNGAIDMSFSGGTPFYDVSWEPGGMSTEDIDNLTAGVYSVTVTDDAGCIGVNQAIVKQEPPDVNPICLVTVDTASGMNMVIWEKAVTEDVSHYNVYRESSVKADFQLIGSVNFDEESLYVDSIADPTIRSWRYRLSVVDDCGNESELSDYHKTMHLTMNVGLDETVNLLWDHYEGFDFDTYEIFRYDSAAGWNSLVPISSNNTSYTDISVPTTDFFTYFIEVEHPTGCTSDDKKASTLNSSKSNRKNRLRSGGTGYPDLESLNNFRLYPNPGQGMFNLSVDLGNLDNVSIKVFDITGKIVMNGEFENVPYRLDTQIDLTGHPDGIYQVHLKTNKAFYHRILIKR